MSHVGPVELGWQVRMAAQPSAILYTQRLSTAHSPSDWQADPSGLEHPAPTTTTEHHITQPTSKPRMPQRYLISATVS